jgi:ethanolamine utilization microcompartment shell protein EutS
MRSETNGALQNGINGKLEKYVNGKQEHQADLFAEPDESFHTKVSKAKSWLQTILPGYMVPTVFFD